MKTVYLFVILILVSSVSFAQNLDLVYKFKEGDTVNFREITKISSDAKVMGEAYSNTEETDIDINEKIMSVSKEKAKIKQISTVTKNVVDGKSVLNDLADEDKVTTVFYEVSPKGRLVGLNDEKDAPLDGFDAKTEKDFFAPKGVNIGDTWDCQRNIQGAKVKVKCKLEKIYAENGVDIAYISLLFDDTIVEKDNNTESTTKVTGTGKCYFAVNLGNDLYIDYNLKIETKASAEVNGQSGDANINTDFEYKYWRTKQ